MNYSQFIRRAQRSLPVSIISTVDLMRLALLDEVVHLDSSPVPVEAMHIRLAYAMALVRFVNLSTGNLMYSFHAQMPTRLSRKGSVRLSVRTALPCLLLVKDGIGKL